MLLLSATTHLETGSFAWCGWHPTDAQMAGQDKRNEKNYSDLDHAAIPEHDIAKGVFKALLSGISQAALQLKQLLTVLSLHVGQLLHVEGMLAAALCICSCQVSSMIACTQARISDVALQQDASQLVHLCSLQR